MSRPPIQAPPPPCYGPSPEARRKADLLFLAFLGTFVVVLVGLIALAIAYGPREPSLRLIAETPEGCRIYQPRGLDQVTICPESWRAS